MVARALAYGILLALLLPLPLLAAVRLQLPESMELGRVVKAELWFDGPQREAAAPSLAPLEAFFHIEEVRRDSADEAMQHLYLKLLPLRSGPVALPEWGISAARIAPARDRKRGEPIELDFSPPRGQAWQRQALAYGIEVETPQRFIRLQWAELRDNRWRMQMSESRVEVLGDEAARRYRHRYTLWLWPLQSGLQILQLPALSYLHDGVATHRFYPPVLRLPVQPLPSYLPVTTQVGQLSLQQIAADNWLRAGERGELQLSIRAEGVPASMWTLATPELATTPALLPLPAVTELSEEFGPEQVSTFYHVRLPFESKAGQLWSTQALRLEYFDPVQGKRVTRSLALRLPWIIPTPLWWSLMLLLALVASVLLWRLLVLLLAQRRKARLYLQAWAQLQQAADGAALRRVQRGIAEAEGWPPGEGSLAWQARWQRLLPGRELAAWSAQMQALCYRGEAGRLPQVQQGLAQMWQQRLGWRRWWFVLLGRLPGGKKIDARNT